MLILDAGFPRSLRFCVGALERNFGLATTSTPRMHALPVARELALLGLDLGSTNIGEIMRGGLHEFLGEFQGRLNRVHSLAMNEILRALPASMP